VFKLCRLKFKIVKEFDNLLYIYNTNMCSDFEYFDFFNLIIELKFTFLKYLERTKNYVMTLLILML